MDRIQVIDSHTAGEPTRLIVAGGPDLGRGDLAAQRDRFAAEFDHVRRTVVHEPRGSEVLVGGLLCASPEPGRVGVIFFNTAGFLGMCGHGTIGLVETLLHLGRHPGQELVVDTPVGAVTTERLPSGEVAIENVESYRHLAGVVIDVPGRGTVTGDVAWGGNWFFLVTGQDRSRWPALEAANARELTALCLEIRAALWRAGVRGANGAQIDHVELFSDAAASGNHSRNFVLCPGGAYDRSPCGTGTSAKLSCLAADGRLQPGDEWRQESIIGSTFTASYRTTDRPGVIVPRIVGRAHVTASAELLSNPDDPFRHGFDTGEALP